MKKSILAIAVAATMAAPAAVMAAPTVYGNIHLSINDIDTQEDLDLASNTSAIGVKGSEDLGNGLKAIYKAEWQMDPAGDSTAGASGGLKSRDQFVGLKGGMGTLKLGTMSTNYKQKGGKVDSLYRTPVEGRGLLHTQSNLHNGKGIDRGRMTNGVQYSSPKMGGIQLVVNTTLSDDEDETIGVGLRYETKGFMAYVDWIDGKPIASAIGGAFNSVLAAEIVANAALAVPLTDAQVKANLQADINPSIGTEDTESAVKVGGKYSTKAFHVAAQYEDAEDLTGYNYIHLNAGYNIDKNNSIQVTYGEAEHVTFSDIDTESFAVAYNHQLSKMTNVYLAYGDRSSDSDDLENDALALGIRKKF